MFGDRKPLVRRPQAVAALTVAVSLALALTLAGTATAAGGRYTFDGGTAPQQAQVRAALDASLFDWDRVPAQITIHIAPGLTSCGVPGEIFLDADLLDAGRFSWGVVQHEYAHQVDFFVLDDAMRERLGATLGGSSWWQTPAGLPHGELTSERFASTLAWAYWPSPANSMRPASPREEAAAATPAAFRSLLGRLLGVAVPSNRELAAARR